MSLLHYPSVKIESGIRGISPNVDSDALTLLLPAPNGGLFFQLPNRDWHEVDSNTPHLYHTFGAYPSVLGRCDDHSQTITLRRREKSSGIRFRKVTARVEKSNSVSRLLK